VCVECLIGKLKNPILFSSLRSPIRVCVECLIGKQKKPILFKVTVGSECGRDVNFGLNFGLNFGPNPAGHPGARLAKPGLLI